MSIIKDNQDKTINDNENPSKALESTTPKIKTGKTFIKESDVEEIELSSKKSKNIKNKNSGHGIEVLSSKNEVRHSASEPSNYGSELTGSAQKATYKFNAKDIIKGDKTFIKESDTDVKEHSPIKNLNIKNKNSSHGIEVLSSKNEVHHSASEPFNYGSEFTGSAQKATYKFNAEDIIKGEKSGSAKDKIKKSLESSIKDSLLKGADNHTVNHTSMINNTNQVNEVKEKRSKNKFTENLNRELMKETSNVNSDTTLGDNVKGHAVKYLARSPHYFNNLKKEAVDARTTITLTSRLVKGMKSNTVTGKEAAILGLKRGGISLKSSGARLGKDVAREVEDFRGSDDLGIETVSKTKNAIINTNRTLKVTSRAVKAVKAKQQSNLRKIQLTKQKIQQITEYALKTARALSKILSNPLVLKTVAIGLVAVLAIMVAMAGISAVASLFASTSYTASDNDLSDTFTYITEKDTTIAEEIYNIPSNSTWSHINEFHIDAIPPKTDPVPIISYLSVKYDDFTLGLVRSEIDYIYNNLYSLVYTQWTTQEETTTPELDEDGNFIYDDEGNLVLETIKKDTNHLRVSINSISWDTYIMLNKTSMFPNNNDLERYHTLNEIGGTSLRSELGRPFTDKTVSIIERYGYVFNGLTGVKTFHGGIKIAVPIGTTISAAMSGTVSTGYDSEYGNYIVISSGTKKVKYFNCSNIQASGNVNKGQPIGVSGNYLYMEYEKEGKKLNPVFFIDSEQFTS